MLNFRRLRQDFAPSMLREGRELHTEGAVTKAKILHLDASVVRVGANIQGKFENVYEIEIEIDRQSSELTDSNCDCTYSFDCQHIAGLLFYLEKRIDEMLVAFSDKADLGNIDDHGEKQALEETIKRAQSKESARRDKEFEREVLAEYVKASEVLATSPFFMPAEEGCCDAAEPTCIFTPNKQTGAIEIQVALRLPQRSKPLHVPDLKAFVEAIRYSEPIWIGGRQYLFTLSSFSAPCQAVFGQLLDALRFQKSTEERAMRAGWIDSASLGRILSSAYHRAREDAGAMGYQLKEGEHLPLKGLYLGGLEEPICFSPVPAILRFVLEYISSPAPNIYLKPTIVLGERVLSPGDLLFLASERPGLLHEGTYYPLAEGIQRRHLQTLKRFQDLVIPEPLFGTLVENALPELSRFAEIAHEEVLDRVVTLPYVGEVQGRCELAYIDGELEAKLFFKYDLAEVPAVSSQLDYSGATAFVESERVLARNLVEEHKVRDKLFQGFIFNADRGVFVAKTDRKIVEFMTEIVPRNKERVGFECPQNLLDKFLYDDSTFELRFTEVERVDVYKVQLKVNGHLKGVSLDRLWDSIAAKRTFIELKDSTVKTGRGQKGHKILVLDLERIRPIIQFFDELGLTVLDDHEQERPLWSLAGVNPSAFNDLPLKISVSAKLKDIQQQLLGQKGLEMSDIPSAVQADLRKYQIEGVHWLERLRKMHLSGILADDMGLGKTLQAITALTQHLRSEPEGQSLVVCPTSLLYNWKEEILKFNPELRSQVVDGTPSHRKRLIERSLGKGKSKPKGGLPHVLITSYTLLQKDIEHYQERLFAYAVLDEAQHIKNRGTRNARSVKLIRAAHRLILTGTPVENSLEELWSLFDFLMPGLLSSFDRFVEKYIRNSGHGSQRSLESLNRKVAPFILRRTKQEVLDDLPPVSEIIYRCQLSETQKKLYQSYASSAREELSRLVQREGFDKVQIHVLATLTRLKQICCHPAIFAKDNVEEGDSSKYDMLTDLLQSLIEGRHKTVIFSQYTRMLKIMREDLERLGVRFAYLDGSSKNRLEIVKQFNEDPSVLVFLVSLKAGGTGLNLTAAKYVIHFDLWWNYAVQKQATDRVHRIGQKQAVSSIKLVTKGTIEEKILQMQERKKGLAQQVVNADEEAFSKLTWEEVLELLQF